MGEGGRESGSPALKGGAVKKYGTIDREGFAHPKVRRPEAITIDGCCTIEATSAKVMALQGDAQLRVVEGPGYRAEISFGFAEGDGDFAGRSIARKSIDGVVLRRLSDTGEKLGPGCRSSCDLAGGCPRPC